MQRLINGLTCEFGSTDVIDAVNLKVTTSWPSPIIDFAANGLAVDFLLAAKFVSIGAVSAGVAKIQVECFSNDGTTVLLPITDIVTGITLPPTDSTSYLYVLATPGRAPRKIAGPAATLVTTDSDLFTCMGKMRFTLKATTASDAATSCTGSLFIRTTP